MKMIYSQVGTTAEKGIYRSSNHGLVKHSLCSFLFDNRMLFYTEAENILTDTYHPVD